MVVAGGNDERLGAWIIDRELGVDAAGTLYACHDEKSPTITAAIKVLGTEPGGRRDRLVREARILQRLDHPNIVKVRHVSVDADPPFIQMDLVAGEPLEVVLDGDPPLTPRASVAVFRQLVEALAYLHGEGVQHLNVKPASIIVGADGKVTLVDFGIAVTGPKDEIASGVGAMAAYVPPEWTTDPKLDRARWDVYAAGLVAYEMFSNRQAFSVPEQASRTHARELFEAKRQVESFDPGPDVSVEMRGLVQAMTAVDPELRPRSMVEVREALKAMEMLATPQPAAPRRPEPDWRVVSAPEAVRRRNSRGAVAMPSEALVYVRARRTLPTWARVLILLVLLATAAGALAGPLYPSVRALIAALVSMTRDLI
jgi:serine/threonine protein kinase